MVSSTGATAISTLTLSKIHTLTSSPERIQLLRTQVRPRVAPHPRTSVCTPDAEGQTLDSRILLSPVQITD